MDAGMRCLDMLLSVSERLVFDLSDAAMGRDLSSCLLYPEKYSGLALLPAPAEKGLVSEENLKAFLEGLENEEFDLVVADLPAGCDTSLYKCFPTHTDFICVCNPNPVSVRDGATVGRILREIHRNGFLLINRFEPYYIQNPVFSNLDNIIDETGLKLLGIIPESEKLAFAFLDCNFPARGKVWKAFTRTAKRILGENVPLPKLKKI
jgi:septum formation inhibitor-activating ATPase MinD